MKHIEPIDWDTLNQSLQGEFLSDAMKAIAKQCVDKVNEMVKVFNEL